MQFLDLKGKALLTLKKKTRNRNAIWNGLTVPIPTSLLYPIPYIVLLYPESSSPATADDINHRKLSPGSTAGHASLSYLSAGPRQKGLVSKWRG